MDDLSFSDSITVECSPHVLYSMIADVTRTGEWSPVCTGCWWDDDDERGVGSWFTGGNETAERTWDTRCQVVAADPGREFAFIVSALGLAGVRWGYTFSPVDGGTRVTQSWAFLPGGIAAFEQRFGADAQAQIADRAEAARAGIPATLAAVKKAAESA